MHRVLHGLVGVSSAGVSRDVVFVLSDPCLLWHRRVEASVAKKKPRGGGPWWQWTCRTSVLH